MTIKIPAAFKFLWDKTADDGSPVRYRAAWGGRGSGKSVNFIRALVIKAAASPLKILCAREIQGSIKDSVKAEIEQAITDCGLASFYTVLDQEIRGYNGSLFIFSGLRHNIDTIKSKAGIDICFIEEASNVSQTSLQKLGPTIRKPGSEIWAVWNPDLESDPINVTFRGENGPPPGSIVRKVNYTDNPYFAETPLLRDMEYDLSRDPERHAHVWLGDYKRNSEARVFRNWTVREFTTPDEAVLRFGADWGFAVDPTVLVRAWVEGRTLYIDHEAYKVGCEIDETPSLFAGSHEDGKWPNFHLHTGIPGARKWLITADSARPETVSYMKRQGFKIAPAIKGPGSIEDGIEFLRTFDIVVHPRCVRTIEELTLFSWKTDPLTGQILPVLADKDNHVIDALRYSLEALRRARKPTKPEGKPDEHNDYRKREIRSDSDWQAA